MRFRLPKSSSTPLNQTTILLQKFAAIDLLASGSVSKCQKGRHIYISSGNLSQPIVANFCSEIALSGVLDDLMKTYYSSLF